MSTDIVFPKYSVSARSGEVTLSGRNERAGVGRTIFISPGEDIALIRATNPEFPAGAWLQAEKLLDEINKINLTGGYR